MLWSKPKTNLSLSIGGFIDYWKNKSITTKSIIIISCLIVICITLIFIILNTPFAGLLSKNIRAFWEIWLVYIVFAVMWVFLALTFASSVEIHKLRQRKEELIAKAISFETLNSKRKDYIKTLESEIKWLDTDNGDLYAAIMRLTATEDAIDMADVDKKTTETRADSNTSLDKAKSIIHNHKGFLRTVDTALEMIRNSLSVDLVNALKHDPFEDWSAFSSSNIFEVFAEEVKRSLKSLNEFIDEISHSRKNDPHLAELTDDVKRMLKLLGNINSDSKNIPSTLNTYSQKIIISLIQISKFRKGLVSKEHIKKVILQMLNLERLTALYHITEVRSRILKHENELTGFLRHGHSELHFSNPRELVLYGLVRKVEKELRVHANLSNIDVKFKKKMLKSKVFGIEEELSTAIKNLLHNAITYCDQLVEGRKYTGNPARAYVNIDSAVSGKYVKLTFESWGRCLSDQEQSQIFKEGYYSDQGSTGYGLFEAREIAINHGGDIRLESRKVQSSGEQKCVNIFTLLIPEA